MSVWHVASSGRNKRAYKKRYNARKSVPKALEKKISKALPRNLKLTTPFRKILDKHLKSQDETHWQTIAIKQSYVPPRPYQPTGQGPIGMHLLMPKIAQVGVPTVGVPTGETANIESRTGSKVKLNSLTCDLTLQLNPRFSQSAPGLPNNINTIGVYYKVMICTCKLVPSYSDFVPRYFVPGTTPGLEDEIFRDGAATDNWDKNLENCSLPVNTNMFTVHAQKSGYLTQGFFGGNSTGTYQSNGAMPIALKNIRLKVNCKSKILKYTELDTIYPTNFQPFLVVFWKSLDGYDYITPATTPSFVNLAGKAHMSWDDLS